MTKRRRLESGDAGGGGEYVGSSGGWEQESASASASEQQQHDSYAALFGGNSVENVPAAAGAAQDTAAGASSSASASVLNESSDLSSAAHWHSSAASPYPDIASYSQEPYFYQHTDPNTYNSPWPPADAASFAAASQAGTYPVPPAPSAAAASAGAMPFFPGQTRREPEEGYDAANEQSSFQHGHTQDVEPVPQYGYVQQGASGQSRSDVPGASSHLYFDDASMHVKVQSLPILENLV